jgi:xylulokinase
MEVDHLLFLGIDIGTTNCKLTLRDSEGRPVDSASFPSPAEYTKEGWVQYDPHRLWRSLTEHAARLLSPDGRGSRVRGICVSSQGESGLLVDKQNDPLTPIMVWHDERTLELADQWKSRISADELFAITGLELQHIHSLIRLEWLKIHEPEAYRKARRWHCLSDYIALRLCGVAAMDYSIASRTMAFDIRNKRWIPRLFDLAGIRMELMPPLVPSGTVLARVLPEIREKWGVHPDAVVVAGGFDHMVGCAGLDAGDPEQVVASVGTTEAVCLYVPEPITEIRRRNGYTIGRHVMGNAYYQLGSMPSGGETIEWAIRTLLRREADEDGYREFQRLAASSPPGSNGVFFLPHLKGCVIPEVDQQSRGGFWGLSLRTTTADLCRAVMEGICFEFRHVLEQGTDVRIDSVVAIGGGTKNEIWMQCKADVLNATVIVYDESDVVPFGAAKLAARACGVPMDQSAFKLSIKRVYTPSQHAEYDRIYHQVYKSLYERQKGVGAFT